MAATLALSQKVFFERIRAFRKADDCSGQRHEHQAVWVREHVIYIACQTLNTSSEWSANKKNLFFMN